jgi:hypothetical protein
MKKIVGINEELKDLEGNKITGMTVKKALIQYVSMARVTGEDALRLTAIGVELLKADKDFEFLEESEAVLIKAVNDNGVGYPAIICAFVYDKVKHAVAFKK